MTVAVAPFSAVGVLVTINGMGVRVASTIFRGVGVAVPVVCASAVRCATSVAAARTSRGVGVAVTTNGVSVGVGNGVGCLVCVGLTGVTVAVSLAARA